MNAALSQIAPEILKVIKESQNILLHLHPRPDGDSVGSSLAMREALRGMGKSVTLIKGDSPLPGYLSHLPGFDSIVPKNIFEIDLSAFDLFIIQDSGDMGKVTTLGELVFPDSLTTVVIDHHASNVGFGKINLIEISYPSVCQMLTDLFQEWKVPITHDMAVCLMLGMYTDTGGFKYKGVTADTFTSASLLAAQAPDFNKAIVMMESQNTKKKIAYEGLALSSVTTYLNDTVAVSTVPYVALQEKGIPREEAKSDIANVLKSVIGWQIGISAVEEAPNEIKISLRTKDGDKYDLSKVAEALGGGGHKAASGIFIKMPLQEVVAKLIQTIEGLYGPELK